MALQSSGQIKLSEIQSEFGGSNPINMSSYYGQGGTIPSSGQIKTSNFYGQAVAYTFSYNVMDESDRCSRGGWTFYNGGLRVKGWGNGGPNFRGTKDFSSGKYYYEVYTSTGYVDGMNTSLGWHGSSADICNAGTNQCFVYYGYTGNVNNSDNWGSRKASGLSSWSAGQILNIAMDLDNGRVWFGINGSWGQGNPSTGTSPHYSFTPSGSYSPRAGYYDAYGTRPDNHFNFGQNGTFNGNVTAGGYTDTNGSGNFKYSVPTGFQGVYTSNRTYPVPT